jgi:hypothetical protein
LPKVRGEGGIYIFYNRQIFGYGFQSVAINIQIKGWLKICSSYVVYSQIWLNLPKDHHSFLHLRMDDCHFRLH